MDGLATVTVRTPESESPGNHGDSFVGRLDEYVRLVVDGAPTLTAEQRAKVVQLLGAVAPAGEDAWRDEVAA